MFALPRHRPLPVLHRPRYRNDLDKLLVWHRLSKINGKLYGAAAEIIRCGPVCVRKLSIREVCQNMESLVRLVEVEGAEVLRGKFGGHGHVVAVAVAQVGVGIAHAHQHMSAEFDGPGFAVNLGGEDASRGFVVVVGYKSGLDDRELLLESVGGMVGPGRRYELVHHLGEQAAQTLAVLVGVDQRMI